MFAKRWMGADFVRSFRAIFMIFDFNSCASERRPTRWRQAGAGHGCPDWELGGGGGIKAGRRPYNITGVQCHVFCVTCLLLVEVSPEGGWIPTGAEHVCRLALPIHALGCTLWRRVSRLCVCVCVCVCVCGTGRGLARKLGGGRLSSAVLWVE